MTERCEIVVGSPGSAELRLVISERLEIGRDCSGLILNDNSVSRRHLSVEPGDGGLVVCDLGSSNGSTRNGTAITEPTTCHPGDVISFGSSQFRVDRPGSGPPAPPGELGQTSIARVADAARDEVPTLPPDWGTVTIAFSDIESSTDHCEALGDTRWHALLAEHDALVHRTVAGAGGRVVKSLGDGFLMVFPGARQAADTMAEIQRLVVGIGQPYGRDFRIRVGLHTGEVINGDDGDVFGHHVVMAARVSDKAAGGELLVSSLTRSIIESRGDLAFGPSREVDLKGLGGRHVVHPVVFE